ncbi:MAG TPA: energy transducer TonB [Bacteroidales bacterium]|jgi:TonB family protein|nr:energy transducer TonB [Bacteroidales bacterium]
MKKNINNLIPAILLTAFVAACNSSEMDSVKTDAPKATASNSSQTTDKPYSVMDGDTVWVMADEMPLFHGGDSALLSYLSKNTIYPEAAVKSGIQGKCIVRFCVTGEGNVDQVSILQGVSPELDAEAIRVVGSLPGFEYPAMKNGKPVAVWYMVPIQFKLK